MFDRAITAELESWAERPNRKPLVLRGARQVGKTTAVEIFSKKFKHYIYLNLENHNDRQIFEKKLEIKELIQAVFFLKNKRITKEKTLIFIDEIQNCPQAVSALRYFYESAGDLFVIAAGSVLESLIDKQINFPVGRVEYLYMKPLTFTEYLTALAEVSSLEMLQQIPCPDFSHEKLLNHFYKYTLIGGMPEIIRVYAETGDIYQLKPVYEGLLRSYLDDVEKYAGSKSSAKIIRHAIESSFFSAGNRIRFEGFGSSHYKSREISEALRTLEKAMLIYLVYPVTGVKPPAVADRKKSPRLHCIDIGLVNYFSGLQKELFGARSLDSVYEGKIIEQAVGQELLANSRSLDERVQFWVREKKQSSAQIDYVIPFENYLIPVEVKSGAAGRLRSLHEFIDRAPHAYAVRLCSGTLSIDKIKTIKGKSFSLLNIPFYLAGYIKQYLSWFIKNQGARL